MIVVLNQDHRLFRINLSDDDIMSSVRPSNRVLASFDSLALAREGEIMAVASNVFAVRSTSHGERHSVVADSERLDRPLIGQIPYLQVCCREACAHVREALCVGDDGDDGQNDGDDD